MFLEQPQFFSRCLSVLFSLLSAVRSADLFLDVAEELFFACSRFVVASEQKQFDLTFVSNTVAPLFPLFCGGLAIRFHQLLEEQEERLSELLSSLNLLFQV